MDAKVNTTVTEWHDNICRKMFHKCLFSSYDMSFDSYNVAQCLFAEKGFYGILAHKLVWQFNSDQPLQGFSANSSIYKQHIVQSILTLYTCKLHPVNKQKSELQLQILSSLSVTHTHIHTCTRGDKMTTMSQKTLLIPEQIACVAIAPKTGKGAEGRGEKKTMNNIQLIKMDVNKINWV